MLMIVCRAFSSGDGGRFIDTTGTMGGGSDNGTTSFGTFLFRTTGNSVLVAFGDYDLLHKL